MPVSISGTNGVTFPDSSLQAAAASPYVLKNRIINGDMVISQRSGTASTTPTTDLTYNTVDRWQSRLAASSKYSLQQNAGSVTPPAGFTNYLGVTSLAATSVSGTDYYAIEQKIEGFNTADLSFGTANAQTITLSFWVRSSLTGTFGGNIRNETSNYCYPFSYTISSANTWEKKTVTIAGATAGTWVGATNAAGMNVAFNLGVGSTYTGTANAWYASTTINPTGATSVVGTNGATFYITGVQLEIGTTATPFERRLYNQELANCQRYCEQLTVVSGSPSRLLLGMATAQSTTTLYGIYWYKVIKRVAPTTTITGTNQYRTLGPNNGSPITSIGTGDAAPDTWFFTATSTGYTVGQTNLVQSNDTATTTINWSAEL